MCDLAVWKCRMYLGWWGYSRIQELGKSIPNAPSEERVEQFEQFYPLPLEQDNNLNNDVPNESGTCPHWKWFPFCTCLLAETFDTPTPPPPPTSQRCRIFKLSFRYKTWIVSVVQKCLVVPYKGREFNSRHSRHLTGNVENGRLWDTPVVNRKTETEWQFLPCAISTGS